MSVCSTRKNIIARILCTTAAAWLLCANPVSAHNVWLEPDAQGGYVLQFGGHEGRTEAFDPAKLQRVHAYDLRGREVPSAIQNVQGGIRIKPDASAALIAVELDNGYFSSTGAEGAVMQRPLGQMFEVVPLQGQSPHAGQPLRLQVLLHGKPQSGVRLSWGEKGSPTMTDAQGLATMTPAVGSNTLQAILRQPVQGDPMTTENSYEYLLRFAVH